MTRLADIEPVADFRVRANAFISEVTRITPDEIRIIRLADVLATRSATLGVLAEVLNARKLGNLAEILAAKTSEGCVINLWGDSGDKSSLEQYLGQVKGLSTEYSAIFLNKYPFRSLIDAPVLSSSPWEFKLYYLFI